MNRPHLPLALVLALASSYACGDDGAVPADAGGALDATVADAGGGLDGGDGADGGGPGDAGGTPDGGTDAGPPPPPGPMVVYVSLSGDDEILVLSLDQESGALTELHRIAASTNVGSLAADPDAGFLYAALRGRSSVGTYSIDPVTGRLTAVDTTNVGESVVYLAVDATGGTLLWASYGGDRIQTHRFAGDGSVQNAQVSGFDTRTNPHAIVLDPSNRFVLVPNTNSDVIQQYLFDATTGALAVNDPLEVDVPAGTGPRHLDFHPTLDLVYVVNEHADSVTRFAFDADAGTLTSVETLSTLPDGVGGGGNTCADIHVHPDGHALYASNRGHDSIAVFTLDAEGAMTAAGHVDTEQRPREFGLDPYGRWLFAAGQDSGNLASYAIEDDGSLTPLDVTAVGGQPLWVEVVELPGE